MKRISTKEVEQVAHELARHLMTWNEPIPDFSTRFPNVLERCLITPFQTFTEKDLYPSFIEKSAILFYLMIKNHPFQNGNKRIAVTTLLYFCYKNKKWIQVSNQEIYNFAKWVAESPAELKTGTVIAIQDFIKAYGVNLTAD